MSSIRSQYGTRFNVAPPGFNPETELPEGFFAFLTPLHEALTPRQQELARRRATVLAAAHEGQKPNYLPPSEATTTDWTIPLPDWCADQRNQMTGPADDAELVVKMLNSCVPGVMLDL
jgi:malate synthase